MLDLASQERLTYESMWQVEDYARTSPGGQLVPAFMEMAGAEPRTYAVPRELWKGLLKNDAPFWSHQTSVLDAGCGSGKGAVALEQAGFRVEMCDLTNAGLIPEAQSVPFHRACLWDDLRVSCSTSRIGGKFDYVYCCDVLEHIPTPFVMLVVSRLLDVAKRGLFLSIAMQGDNFGVWVGKPLHQTVMSFVQWRDQLSALGTVKECRDMLMNGLYYVEPKQ